MKPSRRPPTPVRPQVTLKFAQTIDGRIATASGHSRWISSSESRVLAHRLRAEHDAVLVGIGTVAADDPQLTVRLWKGLDPMRVVVDSKMSISLDAAVFGHDPSSVVIASTHRGDPQKIQSVRALGARVLVLPGSDLRVDLAPLLRSLSELGVKRLLVEGGAKIITSFLRDRLADELVVFTAPKIIGTGVDAIGPLGIQTVDEAISLREVATSVSGGDLVIRGRLVWNA